MNTNASWKLEDVEILIRLYPVVTIIELAKIFKCKRDRIYKKANAIGLKKTYKTHRWKRQITNCIECGKSLEVNLKKRCKECGAAHKKEYNKNFRKVLRNNIKRARISHSDFSLQFEKRHASLLPEYRDRYKKIWKEERVRLDDNYIAAVIQSRTGLKKQAINQNPELIENYRKQIKLKRKLKSLKNGKSIIC